MRLNLVESRGSRGILLFCGFECIKKKEKHLRCFIMVVAEVLEAKFARLHHSGLCLGIMVYGVHHRVMTRVIGITDKSNSTTDYTKFQKFCEKDTYNLHNIVKS